MISDKQYRDFILDDIWVKAKTFIQSLNQEYIELERELIFYPTNLPKEGEERPPYRIKTIRVGGQLMAYLK